MEIFVSIYYLFIEYVKEVDDGKMSDLVRVRIHRQAIVFIRD